MQNLTVNTIDPMKFPSHFSKKARTLKFINKYLLTLKPLTNNFLVLFCSTLFSEERPSLEEIDGYMTSSRKRVQEIEGFFLLNFSHSLLFVHLVVQLPPNFFEILYVAAFPFCNFLLILASRPYVVLVVCEGYREIFLYV